MSEERVAALLRDVADGKPPPADGLVEVVPQPPGPVAGILAFTAHHVVAADVDPAWVHDLLPEGDLGAPVAAPFVTAMIERLGVAPSSLDLVFVANRPGAGGAAEDLVPVDVDGGHRRAARALRYRTDLRAWRTPDGAGLLLLGRGLAGRWEAAFEVEPGARGRGLGRRLAAAAPALAPAGEPVWVQVAPGNVPSVRAILAAGCYVPVGGELLFAVGPAAR